jgi:hypothetical protein
MQRREFIKALGGAVVALPISAHAARAGATDRCDPACKHGCGISGLGRGVPAGTLTFLCKFNAPPDLDLAQIKGQENKAAATYVRWNVHRCSSILE